MQIEKYSIPRSRAMRSCWPSSKRPKCSPTQREERGGQDVVELVVALELLTPILLQALLWTVRKAAACPLELFVVEAQTDVDIRYQAQLISRSAQTGLVHEAQRDAVVLAVGGDVVL